MFPIDQLLISTFNVNIISFNFRNTDQFIQVNSVKSQCPISHYGRHRFNIKCFPRCFRCLLGCFPLCIRCLPSPFLRCTKRLLRCTSRDLAAGPITMTINQWVLCLTQTQLIKISRYFCEIYLQHFFLCDCSFKFSCWIIFSIFLVAH